ncbi:hypothetical protein [Halalkalibacterium halodurans]|uniref:hypothetical protein n=1 Tax=Halalkalibacterium halodurans TaxID=86665 RepID=UPI002AA97DB4|nr:hypothetical protein [Halalkalibacterium halodurans]MDY7224685.1 hypothetical protein [Halalkalibacterium halodurans]MDY7243265.1 hypothetical protein [Halalkalibacterium halodurans]
MTDFNVQTQLQQSEINGLYQEIEELKNKRIKIKDEIDKKTEKIIQHILKHGNVIAYKDNIPHVLTVNNARTKKFDKSALATDLEVSASELNLIGVAELVEERRISSDRLKEYEYEDTTQKLKARKARKTDIELIFGGNRS